MQLVDKIFVTCMVEKYHHITVNADYVFITLRTSVTLR